MSANELPVHHTQRINVIGCRQMSTKGLLSRSMNVEAREAVWDECAQELNARGRCGQWDTHCIDLMPCEKRVVTFDKT